MPVASIGRPCIVCGRRTTDRRGRCAAHLYRVAYRDPSYGDAKAIVRIRSGGRCEALEDGVRCPLPATEFDHIVPLREASSPAHAIGLNVPQNLLHVCHGHQRRG